MSDMESLSSSEMKLKLVMHLKNVTTFNYIIQFCDLLISGQELLDESKNIVPEDCDQISELTQKSDSIFEQIKDVVAAVSAEVLIQKFSEALDKDMKPVDEKNLLSVLLETINHESSINSVEYLQNLIYSIERMMKLYYNAENYFSFFYSNTSFTDPVKVLLKLNNFVSSTAFTSVDTILDVFFSINFDNVEVSSEEKSEWRCLLLEAADTIKQSIEYQEGEFKTLFEILETRSSIQYILDLFAECPKKYDIFLKELDKINDCKDIYDELIDVKYNHFIRLASRDITNEDYEYFMAEDYDLLRVARKPEADDDDKKNDDRIYLSRMISELPLNHTWWKKFKRNDA